MTTFMEKFADAMASAQKPKQPEAPKAPAANPFMQPVQPGTRPGPFKTNLQQPYKPPVAAPQPVPQPVNPAQQPVAAPGQFTWQQWKTFRTNPTSLPAAQRDRMRQLYSQWKAQGTATADTAIKQNSGVRQAVKDGYGNSVYEKSRTRITAPDGTPMPQLGGTDLTELWLARNYVNPANLSVDNYIKRPSPDASEHDRFQQFVQRQAFNERMRQQLKLKQDTLARQEHAVAHLQGSFADSTVGVVANPLIRRFSQYDDMTQALTGNTTSEQASIYGDMSREQFGEEAGRRAEQWLRIGGTGVSAVGTGLTMAMTGGMGGAGATGSAWRLIPAAQRAAAMYPTTQAMYESFNSLGDTFTLGGKETDGFRGFMGDVSHATGEVMSNMPKYTLATGVLGEAGHGISLAGKYTGMTPYVQKGFDAMGGTRLMNWLQSVRTPSSYPMYPMSHPVDTAWTMAKNTGKVMANAIVGDMALGLKNGVTQDMESLLQNQELAPGGLDKYKGPGLSTLEPYANIVPSMLDQNDTAAAAMHAGEGEQYQQQVTAQVVAAREASGITTTPEQKQQIAEVTVPNEQWRNARDQAYAAVDPGFDSSASAEEQSQRIAAMDQGKLREALKQNYRNLVTQGGSVDPMVFQDENLTLQDRAELLKQYGRAEAMGQNPGILGKADLKLKSWLHGDEDIAVEMMNKSEGFKRACTAYGQSMLKNMLDHPGSAANESDEDRKMTQAILRALPEENLRQIMAPLRTATPAQLMSNIKTMRNMAGDSGLAGRRLATIGTDIVKERMRSDGAFAKEFIMTYVDDLRDQSASSKQNGATATKFKNILSGDDVNAILQNMDDGQFTDLAKWALGMQSSVGELDAGSQKLLDVFKEAAKNRALDAVKRDPLKNLPVMTSLWMRSRGWEGMADLAENPVLFYGAAALLTGTIMFGGGYDEDNDDDDGNIGGAEAVAKAKHQRELLTKEVFG